MGQNLKLVYNFGWQNLMAFVSKNDSVVDHIMKLKILTKDLSNVAHFIPKKNASIGHS